MSKVSKNLKKIRTEKKITQDALAEKIHVTRQAISNWENDKTKPDIESLEMLAEVLEVDIEELIKRADELKGEFVIIIEKNSCKEENKLNNLSLEEHYDFYKKQGLDKKEIIKKIAKDRNVNKNEIYQYFI